VEVFAESPSPLAVLVVGSGVELKRYLDLFAAAVPQAALQVMPRPGFNEVRLASATSHLAMASGDDRALDDMRAFFDASVTTASDIEQFIVRARGFEERRRAHELPPDLAPSVVPWSASWADSATRLEARIAHVFAACGVDATVDHIGSTSVPGLAAKDIIDLQVAVRRLEDSEACDRSLRSAGFVNVQVLAPGAPGVSRDNARGGEPSSGYWEKRLYASVDAAQRAIVHVRQAGAANWRYALLFRDWLRANTQCRDEYALTKSRLAIAHLEDSNFDDYARAKDFWFDRAYEQSERWASEAGWVAPTFKGREE